MAQHENINERIRALEVEMDRLKEDNRTIIGKLENIQRVIWGCGGVIFVAEIVLKFIGK